MSAPRTRAPRAGIAAGLLLAGSLVGLGPSAAAETRDVVFVGNKEGGTVSVIDVETFAVIGEIDLVPDDDWPFFDRDPVQSAVYPAVITAAGENFVQSMGISPDARTLYVSRGHLGDVAAFDIATGNLLWRVSVSGLRSDHMLVSEDGSQIFVSALTEDLVEVIDTEQQQVIGSVPTGEWPHGLRLSPDGTRVYNGSLSNIFAPDDLRGVRSPAHQMTIFDADTLEIVRTIEFDRGIRPWAVTPDETRLYVQLSLLHGLVEYDLVEDRVRRTLHLPVAEDRDPYRFEAAHHGLVLSPDGGYLCVAGTVSHYVALVSLPTLEPEAIIPVGRQPASLVNSPDGNYCFASSRENDTVSVISYAERQEVARIPVGEHPQYMVGARVPADVFAGW